MSATAVFPNLVAGAPGQVAVSWYGTSVKGDMNSSTDMAGASWNVYVSQTLNATAAQPAFATGVVQQNFHTGVLCTMGTGCSGDGRKLLDFFDMRIDPNGALLVVYTRDLGASNTQIAFARQTSGCMLSTPCSPGTSVPEFSAQAVAPIAGVGVVGAVLLLRRRRRGRRETPGPETA